MENHWYIRYHDSFMVNYSNWKWGIYIIGGVELITKMVLYYFHERISGINSVIMGLIKPYVRNEWDDLKEIIVGTTKGHKYQQ